MNKPAPGWTTPARRLTVDAVMSVICECRQRNFCAKPTFVCVRLSTWKNARQPMSTILIIILILLLVGALPTWPYSSGWGYYPGGGIGLLLVIVIILVLMGRI
jgi:hypothetical protein